MAKYLTPQQVRAGATGINWTLSSNALLADMIAQAEGDIDAYMGFAEDDSLGFLPGERTEKQPWSTKSFRVYPRCMPVPIRALSAFSIVVSQSAGDGSPVQAPVPLNQVIVNNDLGYCEVISTTVTVYGFVPVLLDLAVSEPFVSMTYTAGYSIPKLGFPIYDKGDDLTFHSFIPNWDTVAQTPIVYVNGAVQDPSTYTVNALSGVVTFKADQDPFNDVSVDFTHVIPDIVCKATRKCFLDQVEAWAANQKGMAGLDLIKSGLQEMRRKKALKETMTWQENLDGLKPFQMAPTTQSFRP